MDKNLFISYLKILDIPLAYGDIGNNTNQSIDINHDLPHSIDGDELTHYYFEPNIFTSKELALELHNQRVEEWNTKHPNHPISPLNGDEDIIHPIYIQNKLIYNSELFDTIERNGSKNLIRVINKSALEFFIENIRLSKKYKISLDLEKKIETKITKLQEWFVKINRDPDEIESLLDEILGDKFSDKIETLFEEKHNKKNYKNRTYKLKKSKGGRPVDPQKAKLREKLYKDYYNLTEKQGYKKDRAIEILSNDYPWTKSTILKYLK